MSPRFTSVFACAAVSLAVALPLTGLSAQAAELDDATIVAIFDGANTADMETGALAEKRGASPEVRDFGAMLVRDHRMVRQQGRDLAARLARLGALEGVEFDRAFLQYEAAFHQAVIDAVTSTLLPAIQNPELKALVEKVAPAFQAHLRMAQELEKKIAGAKPGDRASAR